MTSNSTPDLIPLMGARMVRASEPEQCTRLQEGAIKELTGGEPLLARALHLDFVEVAPSSSLIVAHYRALEGHPGIRLVRRDTISVAGIARGDWIVEPSDGSPCDMAFLQRVLAAVLIKDADRRAAES